MFHLRLCPAEEEFVLEPVGIFTGLFFGTVGKHLFAPVTRVITLSVGKPVAEHLALVITAFAVQFVCRIFSLRQDIV